VISANWRRALANAGFLGSMGGKHLNSPIVGIVPGAYALNFANFSLQTTGYSLVASDGGALNFGTANFFGSLGGIKLAAPVSPAG
jgi:hypothetical protein